MSYPSDPSERSAEPAREPDPAYTQYPRGWPSPDDEISLFDIWDALVRQRWLILGVFLTISVLAAGYALLQPDVYRYQAALQIGQQPIALSEEVRSGVVNVEQSAWPEGTPRRPLASPGSVAAQLESSLIPEARRAVLNETESDNAANPHVQVETPSDSGIVRLYVESHQVNTEYIKNLLAKTAQLLVQDHAGFIESQRERFNLLHERLAQQRERVAAEIDQVEQRIARLIERSDSTTSAIALRVDRLQKRIGSLKDRLLNIQNERTRLADALAVLKEQGGAFTQPLSPGTVSQQQEATKRIAAATDGLRPTRVIAMPERLQMQVGTSATLIVALGIILGAMLGVFSAFIVEFLAAARRRHQGTPVE